MAVDYFLKIDGIPGESVEQKHKNGFSSKRSAGARRTTPARSPAVAEEPERCGCRTSRSR